ncbi:MAG TPA: hypothetical protein VEN95_04185 [Actinomycetota bacterium]|jgi:hypothetical protein|nr:hypothetical protein [Actinomycetota bacterium]
MSTRIETLRTRSRSPHAPWLVAAAGLLALLAVLTLPGRVAPDTTVPVRPPAVASAVASTAVGFTTGAAIKAVANDPYLRVTPSRTATRGTGIEATKATVDELRFGPNFNMGRACPKCW